MRLCPLCSSAELSPLYTYPLTSGGFQTVVSCKFCGMVFSSIHAPVDYSNSVYQRPGAIGTGENEHDKNRLMGLAHKLDDYVGHRSRIVDVGCAQGGLLASLKNYGYTNLTGMDPSEHCCAITNGKGFNVIHGGIGDEIEPADCIILSHVLEHVEDVRGTTDWIQNSLTDGGYVYIEVPDASRYAEFDIPFLDFNSEHINHFSLNHLLASLAGGKMRVVSAGERTIYLSNGKPYPAIYVIAKKSMPLKESIDCYIATSEEALDRFNESIALQLGDARECILWGAGEYMTHIANLEIFKRVKIVAVVDRNESLHAKIRCGVMVCPPEAVVVNLPIVVASLVAGESVKRDIEKIGLKNQVITL